MVNSRQKGKRGEREAVQQLKEHWDVTDPRRTAQVDGGLSADILLCEDSIPGLHLEVKYHSSIGALRFMEQAERDCRDGEVPVVLMRENGSTRWVVMIPLPKSMAFVGRLWRFFTKQGPAKDGERV